MDKLTVGEAKRVGNIIAGIVESIENKEVEFFNKERLILRAVEIAEKFKLNGPDKLRLAVDISNNILPKIGVEIQDRLIKDSIEMIIDLSNGKTDINKAAGCCISMCTSNIDIDEDSLSKI